MRILVVGSGGREHALAWQLSRVHPGDETREVICAPGNLGMDQHAECVPVRADDLDGLVRLAVSRQVDLVVVGPEQPLSQGLVDRLIDAGVAVFGPTQAAAELEASKAFAKEIMDAAGIPTARWQVFEDPGAARTFARELGGRVAVKADGLAAGKGVILCASPAEAEAAVVTLMEERRAGEAGRRVVVEERLEGEEVSFIALCDGKTVLPLAGSQDHKPAYDGDRGPNTGGMGALSPTPALPDALAERVLREVMEPAVRIMAERGRPFRGALYAGLMMTAAGPKVLEFNARFGDPETQPLLVRLRSDLGPVLLAAARGELAGHTLDWDPRAAVCVVMASGGYPEAYEVGYTVTGLPELFEADDVVVFHAGTTHDADFKVVTSGGRVLGVTALGQDVAAARRRAYEAVGQLHFKDAHYRRDIGEKAVRT